MPAEPNELELVADASAFTRPELDPVRRVDDPLAIGLVQEDTSIEALCPFDHRRVVERVGDRDRVDATRAREGVRRLVVEQRDAVPEHAVDEKRPLADGERRLGADPEETRLYLIDDVAMITRELGHRRPPLAVVADVLPLVETDKAADRGFSRGRKLRSTRHTDERVHPSHPLSGRRPA